MKQLTKIEIIKETAEFYNSENRGYDYIKDNCMYITNDGKKCAIGRCLNTKGIQAIKNIQTKSFIILFPTNEILDSYLKPKYRGHIKDFWLTLQSFHDTDEFWDKEGLSGDGKFEYEELLKRYK